MSFIEIKNKGSEKGIFALKDLGSSIVVHNLEGDLSEERTRESVEILIQASGKKLTRHITDPLITYMNHSFNPNCRIDKYTHNIITLRSIKEGEELTFNYLEHEGRIVSPFTDYETGEQVK